MQTAPYGSWKSPITSDLIASETIRLGQIAVDGPDVYWAEGRPSEGGRTVVVKRTPDGALADVTPPSSNVRTRVHEYGGAAFAVAEGTLYFSEFGDQRLYRLVPGTEPVPMTPEGKLRYADAVLDRARRRLICVCEDHSSAGREAVNTIASVDLVGSAEPRTLVSGSDFYASPTLSPDGRLLAWLSWNHPNMPWDGTELWVASLDPDGLVADPARVAGGQDESVFQPRWSPDGVLYFVSDSTGWWNLYRWFEGSAEPVAPMHAEFGLPQWQFGMSTYAFATDQRIICAYSQRGNWHLATIDTESRAFQPLPTEYTEISDVQAGSGKVVFIGATPGEAASVVQLDLNTGALDLLQRSSMTSVSRDYLSEPDALEFPSGEGMAHAFFYPPCNHDYLGPEAERPPLIVMSHGGPTGATGSGLSLGIQYWTSRGFAVLDVNYRGSTGYGRAYRQELAGQWGIADVDDCVAGALYLADRGLVDAHRLAIRGGSAGGYTTLCALTFRDLFAVGASRYGIGDLEALALETHKFESRYLDRLVGPYPDEVALYRARSPIHWLEQLSCPVIFFQGLDDKVVPPGQAEAMVSALQAKGIPVAYLPFEGEQHGFRRAENVKRALDAELYFYSKVLGFELPEQVHPVRIHNPQSL